MSLKSINQSENVAFLSYTLISVINRLINLPKWINFYKVYEPTIFDAIFYFHYNWLLPDRLIQVDLIDMCLNDRLKFPLID